MANLAAKQQERKARNTNACNAAISVPIDYDLIHRLSKYLLLKSASFVTEVNARVYSRLACRKQFPVLLFYAVRDSCSIAYQMRAIAHNVLLSSN